MPAVIHVDGLGTEPMDHFEIKHGEALKDVLDRMGVSWRAEDVPAGLQPPRKLDPRAARFLAEYQPEDPTSVLAVYWRYHSLEGEEFDTVEEAERFLESGAEYGSLAGEAIVHGGEIRVLP